jgi:hypothetical protein
MILFDCHNNIMWREGLQIMKFLIMKFYLAAYADSYIQKFCDNINTDECLLFQHHNND